MAEIRASVWYLGTELHEGKPREKQIEIYSERAIPLVASTLYPNSYDVASSIKKMKGFDNKKYPFHEITVNHYRYDKKTRQKYAFEYKPKKHSIKDRALHLSLREVERLDDDYYSVNGNSVDVGANPTGRVMYILHLDNPPVTQSFKCAFCTKEALIADTTTYTAYCSLACAEK